MISVSESIIGEAMVFGNAMLLGAGLMMLYDVIRIFRRIIPRGIIWVSIEDLCYWIVFGFSVFVLLYQETDGAIRGFIVGGIALGLILYYVIFSRWLMKWITRLIQFLKKQLKKAWKAVRIRLCKR